MFLQENTILRPVEAEEDTCTEVLMEHKKLKKKKIEGTGKKFIHMEEHISIHTCKTNQKIRTLKSLLPQHLLVTVTQELTSKKSGYLMSSQSFTGYAKILDIAAATSSVALQSKRTLYRNY